MDVRFTDLKVYLWKGKSVSKMSAVQVRSEPPLHSGSLEVKRATYNRLMLVQVQLRVPSENLIFLKIFVIIFIES